MEANETGIRIAGNNESISREQLRLKVSTIVTQVQNAYAELLYAIENLKVQQRSLDLAQDLMKLNQARVRAGVAAPVEVTQAEAQEAAQVQNVILAQKAVRDNEDALKVVMNIPATGGWGQEIQPTYTLSFEPKSFNLDETIQKALENRYEYKSAKLDIENKELSARLTRNQLLPDLAFTGNVSTNGFGKNWGSDMGSLSGGNYVSYGLGVVLTVPLGNRAAQATYIKAQLTADQAKTSSQATRAPNCSAGARGRPAGGCFRQPGQRELRGARAGRGAASRRDETIGGRCQHHLQRALVPARSCDRPGE